MTKLPIHLKYAWYYGFEVVYQWWLHKPDCVLTNAAGTLMWDFTIVTDSPVAGFIRTHTACIEDGISSSSFLCCKNSELFMFNLMPLPLKINQWNFFYRSGHNNAFPIHAAKYLSSMVINKH